LVKTRKKHRGVLPRWWGKGICDGSIELAQGVQQQAQQQFQQVHGAGGA